MKILFLIDINSLIHRCFHALPPLTSPSGLPTNALYGLSSILIKILKEEKPDFIAAAFDRPEPTFRKKLYNDYKIQRPKAPPELIFQIKEAHNLLSKFKIEFFEKPGFEADDIIGSLAKKFSQERKLKIIILTGDLDLLQLVKDDKIVVLTFKKGISQTKLYNQKEVEERYDLLPEQLVDFKALRGDPSDNITGVKGIGEKTAIKLLIKFYSLENLYSSIKKYNFGDISPSERKIYEKLLESEKDVYLSKKLCQIEKNLDLRIELGDLKTNQVNSSLINYFREMGFSTLIKRLDKKTDFSSDREANMSLFNKQKEIVYLSEDNQKSELISSNLKVGYDIVSLLKSEKISPPFFDLKIAAWLILPDNKDLSLPFIINHFLGKDKPSPENIKELFLLLKREIKRNGLEKIFFEIEMPLIPIICDMEKRGIKISKDGFLELRKKIEEEINKLEKEIFNQLGFEFNLNSPSQVKEALEKIGIKNLNSSSAEVISFFKDEYPIVGLIIRFRELSKIKSSFIEPIIQFEKNGIIHTHINQAGSSTGRLSSEKPNLMNIPSLDDKENYWNKLLRENFIARDNFSFVSFDYSQIELRILAFLSQDKNLISAFKKNIDIHSLTASKIFNLPLEKISPLERRIGKVVNFGIIYGMGAEMLSSLVSISLKRAEKFLEDYFKNFPSVSLWRQEIQEEARIKGYLRNFNGRMRFFKHSGPGAINFPVQSLAADIIKMAMIKTSPIANLILPIHDELLFEIEENKIEEKAVKIKERMENIYNLKVPLKVKIKKGSNLANLKEIIL